MEVKDTRTEQADKKPGVKMQRKIMVEVRDSRTEQSEKISGVRMNRSIVPCHLVLH